MVRVRFHSLYDGSRLILHIHLHVKEVVVAWRSPPPLLCSRQPLIFTRSPPPNVPKCTTLGPFFTLTPPPTPSATSFLRLLEHLCVVDLLQEEGELGVVKDSAARVFDVRGHDRSWRRRHRARSYWRRAPRPRKRAYLARRFGSSSTSHLVLRNSGRNLALPLAVNLLSPSLVLRRAREARVSV